jgi:murein L,D-transpeptidase YcbB/YkuD
MARRHFRDLQGGRDLRSSWAALLILLALTGCRGQDLPPEPPPPEGALCTSIPHESGARSLFHALACYRQIAAWGGWPTLQPAEPLQPGSRSETVETLKNRLRAEGYLPALQPGETESYDYDPAVTAAVVRFQRRHGLEATGSVDAATLAELNVPAAGRVRQIELNLERCRRQPEAQDLDLTTWVDPDGTVHFRSDPFLEKAEGEERLPAEIL